MNRQGRIAELEHEIALREIELQHLRLKDRLRLMTSFDTDEKVEVFEKLYNQAWHYVQALATTGHPLKDGKHYIYEAVMTFMLGEGVWDVINEIL